MSFTSIVYGRIISGEPIDENKKIINSLSDDQAFPWILKEMFSFQELERPHFYDNPIITFGATYKQVEDDLTAWLIKFEDILSRLDFLTAKIQIETEIYGTYDFFWRSKSGNNGNHDDEYYKEMDLKIADKWYYGYGKRNMWGIVENEALGENESDLFCIHGVKHPFEVTPEDNKLVEKLFNIVGRNNQVFFYDLPQEFIAKQDVLWPLLTRLDTEGKLLFRLERGWDSSTKKMGPYIILK